jgi:hypothetical protein
MGHFSGLKTYRENKGPQQSGGDALSCYPASLFKERPKVGLEQPNHFRGCGDETQQKNSADDGRRLFPQPRFMAHIVIYRAIELVEMRSRHPAADKSVGIRKPGKSGHMRKTSLKRLNKTERQDTRIRRIYIS